jgi:hypothetical protein
MLISEKVGVWKRTRRRWGNENVIRAYPRKGGSRPLWR